MFIFCVQKNASVLWLYFVVSYLQKTQFCGLKPPPRKNVDIISVISAGLYEFSDFQLDFRSIIQFKGKNIKLISLNEFN
uniref:Uncharacterized protein n=1 Tax=Cyprinus carpio TaxID=7962 RepID=A0A8C1Q080_CYPCA